MTASRYYWVCGSLALCCAGAFAQGLHPAPPHAFAMPRTRVEWVAVEEEQDRLSAERGPHFKERYPEYAAQWDAMYERIGAHQLEFAGDETIYDRRLAERLISELYLDYGSPHLNGVAPDFVADILNEIGRWPIERLPDEARQVLSVGLGEYLRQGGGRRSPWQQASFASAMDRIAGDDPGSQAAVEALLVDALDWAVTVQDELNLEQVQKLCDAHFGARAGLVKYELEVKHDLPAGPRPERYEKAVVALRALLADPPRDGKLLEALRSATQAALVELDDKRLGEDLVSRLLIAYRSLLQRRPEIPPRASYFIENELLTLSVKERIKSERHWGLWSAAARELGSERISQRFKRYVRAQLDKKDLSSAQREALESLRTLTQE